MNKKIPAPLAQYVRLQVILWGTLSLACCSTENRNNKETTVHNLGSSGLTADSLAELVGSDAFSGSTFLDVSENPIGAHGLRAIGDSLHMGELEFLNASNVGADDAGIAALAQSTNLTPKSLGLRENTITGQGAEALAGSGVLSKVEQLELAFNPIGDRGALALSKSPKLAALTLLDLTGCKIGDKGVAALLASPNLPKLQKLRLALNELSREGLVSLFDAAKLPSLVSLDLPGAAITNEDRTRLTELRPDLSVRRH